MGPQDISRHHDDATDRLRLETPRTLGIRSGMSSSGVIGHKLGCVYEVERDVPSEMSDAIRQLHHKLTTDS